MSDKQKHYTPAESANIAFEITYEIPTPFPYYDDDRGGDTPESCLDASRSFIRWNDDLSWEEFNLRYPPIV